MSDINKIQFDVMEINTDLAKEYFKKNYYQFPDDPALSNNKSEKDSYNNTIFYDEGQDVEAIKNNNAKEFTDDELVEKERKLRKLAQEVSTYKNAELFCQIEYLIRNIPIHEVKEYDIKLIKQYLSFPACKLHRHTSVFRMDESTPLFYLAFAAKAVPYFDSIYIYYTANTAAVCHLFTELCHSVGLNTINTGLQESIKSKDETYSDFQTGCIGVVTECSDVDSAVDTFLRTTTRYPWKLSRIFVQESVYDSFKNAIAWKAKLKAEQVAPGLSHAADSCASAFAYEGKTFLVDFAGDTEAAAGGILVEAFRTTKELISFVEKKSALYLSLWASDISQANEIAYNVPSSIVWINSYGVFDGPPQAFLTIYTEMCFSNNMKNVLVVSSLNYLRNQEVWASMAFEERQRIVQRLTNEFCICYDADADADDSKNKEFFENLKSALRNVKSDNFVYVDQDRMCVGISMPLKFAILWCDKDTKKYTVELIASVLTSGTALVYDYWSNLSLTKYFEYLSTRIPITHEVQFGDEVEVVTSDLSSFVRTKVVWTSFGTVFAN